VGLTVADATTNKPGRTVFGDRYVRFQDITFDSSYPTGGEALTAANVGLKIGIDFISFERKTVGGVAYSFEYDRTSGKLIAYVATTGAQVADTTDLSAVTIRAMVIGK
jgi:hypothetical protein